MPIARFLLALALCTWMSSVFPDSLQNGVAAINRKDYPSAVRLMEPLARSGNPQAQLHLGLLYYHGHGVRENDTLARQWFDRAARQGLADAQFQLGNMYAYGLAKSLGDVDTSRLAAQWYFEAARQGHAQAQYSLGILFLTGSGVQQSESEGIRWIGLAASQGHPDATAYVKGKVP